MIGKIFGGIVAGFFVAVLASFLITIGGASGDPKAGGQAGAVAFFAGWVVSIAVAIMAPRAAKAWRRLLLTSAVLSFSMPLASLIFSGGAVAQAAATGGEHSGAAAAGAALGGGIVTAVSGFVGFFLGVVFLIVGLLVGRDKQQVIVREAEETA